VHFWRLPNGYWTPLTAAILLKPDVREVFVRGINRLVGTLAGATLVTIIVALARPTSLQLALLLLVAVWGCLTILRVNYALFVTCITSYVVLLFAMLGLPEPIVAWDRLQATLAGAAVALAAHACVRCFMRKK
jgi:uncharacterized membrane protein YccC